MKIAAALTLFFLILIGALFYYKQPLFLPSATLSPEEAETRKLDEDIHQLERKKEGLLEEKQILNEHLNAAQERIRLLNSL